MMKPLIIFTVFAIVLVVTVDASRFRRQYADYGQNSPDYGQNSPDYGQNSPDYGQNSPDYGQNSPDYGQIPLDVAFAVNHANNQLAMQMNQAFLGTMMSGGESLKAAVGVKK